MNFLFSIYSYCHETGRLIEIPGTVVVEIFSGKYHQGSVSGTDLDGMQTLE
jgi:hypothetical protein